MTTILSIPLKDGIILCADNLEQSTFLDGSGIDILIPFEKTSAKLFESKMHIYGFAGTTDIIEAMHNLYNTTGKNLDSFEKEFQKNIQSQIQLTTQLTEEKAPKLKKNAKDSLETEVFFQGIFVDRATLEVTLLSSKHPKVKKMKLNDLFKSSFDGIGSGIQLFDLGNIVEVSNIISNVMGKLSTVETSKFTSEHLKNLVGLLDLYSRFDRFTGSPAVYGCEIKVISKGNVDSYKVKSRGISYNKNNTVGGDVNANWWA